MCGYRVYFPSEPSPRIILPMTRSRSRFWMGLVASSIIVSCLEPSTSPPPTVQPTPPSGSLALYDRTGQVVVRFEPMDGGAYRLMDARNTKIGKIKIESDRVKAKDVHGTPRAKVEKKEQGFKVYDGSDRVLFKAKIKGDDRLVLQRDDGTPVGELDGLHGTFGDLRVDAAPEGDRVVLRAAGQPLQYAAGLPANAAMILAVPGLDPYQRAAMMIFLREVY